MQILINSPYQLVIQISEPSTVLTHQYFMVHVMSGCCCRCSHFESTFRPTRVFDLKPILASARSETTKFREANHEMLRKNFRHDESSCEYRLNTELVAWSTCPYYPLQLLLHLCFLLVLCDYFSHIIMSTWNWPSIYKWLAINWMMNQIYT